MPPADAMNALLTRRRRLKRMPSWYKPLSEDPAQLPSEGDLEKQLKAYAERKKSAAQQVAGATGVMEALPRREIETPDFSMNPLMMQPEERYEVSLPRTVSRFFVWIFGLLWLQLGTLWDKLRRRDSDQRRAGRLLRVIQRMGGTLIKVGQQLAMRVDLLPYAYCVELSKLLDRMPVFPLKDAIAAIERATGKKLKEVFARFDPEPIGSASIACVYQAVLRTGEKVAVKVRRPGIGHAFAADLRALRWLIGFVEWIGIIRPGNLHNLAQELEISFMEELDFKREAYLQEVFRRNSQDPKLNEQFFFSSPRVFFEYTSREVIVQDFVAGMWLWEVLAAVEQGNQAALMRMRELHIDPKIVARRLLWVEMWGNLTNVMFHGDPHPANIVVQANNHLIFIDFGACGQISAVPRNRLLTIMRHQRENNVSGAVKESIALLEPLPHIDLDSFEKDLERVYFRTFAAGWSKQAPWWERTTATLWLNLMRITQKYKLPVHPDTVKGLRSSLLYDTLALRLDNDLDVLKEGRSFMRDTTRLKGRRFRKQLRQRYCRGLQLQDYARLDDLSQLGVRALDRLQRFIDHPPFKFASSINKSIYAVITVIKVLAFLGAMLLGSIGMVAAYCFAVGKMVSVDWLIQHVLRSRAFLGLVCAAILAGLRRIMFRLGDQDS